MEPSPADQWEAATPEEVAVLFAGSGLTWWIAGGWAIDLYIGQQTREHGDIDVGVLRREQRRVQAWLAGWELWVADPPGRLRRWEFGRELAPEAHDIWCRRPGRPWAIQLLVNEAVGDRWVSRRDPTTSVPLSEAVLETEAGIPILAPEISLLFKAKHRRARDDDDLAIVRPRLGRHRVDWLRTELARAFPEHPWLEVLGARR